MNYSCPYHRAKALAELVSAAAAVDVIRAEQVARSITHRSCQARALIDIAFLTASRLDRREDNRRLCAEAAYISEIWTTALDAIARNAPAAIRGIADDQLLEISLLRHG